MKAIPLIRATQLEPYLTFLGQIGANSEKFLEQSKIRADILTTPEQLLPEYQVWDFIERAGKANGSAIEFGLQTGLEGNFDFILGLMYPSLTTYDALNRFCLLTRLHSSQASFWLSQKGSEIWFCRQGIPEITIGEQAVEAYTLMLMINLVRYTTGLKHWQPSKICLQMKPNSTIKQFQPLENTRIKYQQQFTAIAIDTTLLSLTQPSTDSPYLSPLINISTPATDFIGSLRQVIKSLSTKKYPTLSQVTQITGISSRTLQRQLREAGLNYTEVIHQIQFERAKIMLKDTDLKLREISEQLGYSTQGHFSRAFKRWTGITPQLFRHFSSEK
ncbi:AraC family transcriptional regulator [Hydrocoleum sp. CS-953]|uniref:AraC family transcriptional regulator n=1 Tax=Hydrocoleum sp. CS-953 TaxID=1671698 RepID=UPI000B9A988C|nr:AraC family transcriptional regulator [Hydrocoleum sp. CS-953]OZH53961.1 AraC family transcriptional regulator [Hydrocoleum sp. CS-953]